MGQGQAVWNKLFALPHRQNSHDSNMQPAARNNHQPENTPVTHWLRLSSLLFLSVLSISVSGADFWDSRERMEFDWEKQNQTSQIIPIPIDTIGSTHLVTPYGDIELCNFTAESNSATRVIAPKQPFDHSCKLIVERSQTQHQFSDGRWQMHPLEKEDNSWSGVIKPTRPGSYRVEVYIKSKVDAPLDMQFSLQSSKAMRSIKSTADPLAVQAFDLGRIKITEPKGSKWSLNIKEASLESIDLSHVVLRPAPEGEPIRQLADGSILLHARDVTVHGTKLQYEALPHKNTVGYWIHETDYPSWDFELLRPGRYAIEILQGCGTGHGGSHMNIKVHESTIPFLVEDTGHFQHFVPRFVGETQFPHPDRYRLDLIPVKKAGGAVMDVRQIRLVPIADKP